jgi:Methyltransferase domain
LIKCKLIGIGITMNRLRSTLEAVLPPRARGFLLEAYYKSVPHQIRSILQGRNRDFVFQQAIKQFLKDPGACAHPGNPVLNDLIYGWGNEAWSARDEYLAGCVAHALKSPGPILECGSGLSTILLGAVAKKQGQGHWVLEHKPGWAKKVQCYLTQYKLDSVVITKPLRDYGDFSWYDVPLGGIPDRFFLVVCDGPPSRTKGGRYGLVPIMKEQLSPGCVILLDDAGRDEELEIAKRWGDELGTSFTIQGAIKPYIQMVTA